jgi:xylulokinase
MPLVAGVDSSTQSVKVVVRDAETGDLVREGRATHPDGTEVHPDHWWSALEAASDGLLGGVEAMAVAAQQHGMVALDDAGEVVRPALLWNDTRSAQDAADLVAEWGGPQAWADAVGSVPVARVLLPHDWLTWRLAGRPAESTTDRGDVSGTGYWSPAAGDYRLDLLELAFGRAYDVPRVAAPHEVVGETSGGIALAPGTGDNMGAALGVGALPGDVVVSLGTSGTAFAVADAHTADPSGQVAGFADATGRFLPLVCTLNAARVVSAAAAMIGTDIDGATRRALEAAPGSGGLVLLPYLDGERTPNLPDASGSILGLTRDAMTPGNLARASIEGMLCGLADAVDALRAQGVVPARIMLVGGAAANPAVQEVATTVFDLPVVVPPPGEYVADGAARQAAWAQLGGAEPPAWVLAGEVVRDPAPVPSIREAYAAARRTVHGS